MWIITAKDIKAGHLREMTITGMDYFPEPDVVAQFNATHGKWFAFESITHTHPLPLEQPNVTIADDLLAPIAHVLASLPSEGGAGVTADLAPVDGNDDTAFGMAGISDD